NVFMPNDFTVKSANMLGAAAVLRPTLLKLNDNFELWFKQDDQFATLKGSIMLSIKLPTANTSPMKNVMSIMYCNLLDSNLRSGLCNARYAGLSFQVRFTNSAIEINVAGFTSKLPDLLMAILERVKFVMIDETQFVRYSADYHQAIGNIDNFMPIQLGDMVIECIEKSSMWNYKLMQSEVANVTPARFKDHVHSLFDVTFTKMVMVGNFNEDDALKAAERGEPNPMYVTLHINKFIDDMQQRLVDMTNEQFNNRVQSLIKQYQERVKNIYTETMRYLREVKSGTYEFALNDKKVKVLQTVAKEELLEFWNKYVNPSTAPAYTRIDVQMWSAKIWKPSVSDVKTYSAKTLAL
ncbi:metalloprotease, partial [Coemansia sp. RSA 2681]